MAGSNAPKEIIPNLFLLQSWLIQADPLSFNGPSWSISSELYIYILFALIIILNRTLSMYIFTGIAGFALLNLLTEHYIFKETAIRVLLCFFLGCTCL